jgi:polycomb protein EED
MSSAYRLSASIKEAHTHPIYCLSFSPEFHTDDDGNESALSYFATCAGPYAHLYEVGTAISNGKKKRRSPMIRQVYRDVDEEEQFYTCAFGGRGVNNTISIGHNQSKVTTKRLRLNAEEGTIYDLALRQGPPLLCVAGKRGMIKVIDTVLQSLVMTLLGHGDAVNDLKCSPTNEWLLLSASKDHSIRLWNLQRGQMIAIYAGHDGHRGQVLCISWHHSGLRFASSAFDNTIKLWNAFDNSKTVAGNGKEGPVQAAIRRSFEMEPGDKFTTAIEQTPYFSTDSIHELPGCVGEYFCYVF